MFDIVVKFKIFRIKFGTGQKVREKSYKFLEVQRQLTALMSISPGLHVKLKTIQC